MSVLAGLSCGAGERPTAPSRDTRERAVVVSAAHKLVFIQVSVGQSHTCGVTITDVAYCWGSQSDGELGNGSQFEGSDAPALVNTELTFHRVSAGDRYTCGVTSEHDAYCWGSNAFGQLGTGDHRSSLTPVAVHTDVKFFDVSVGESHTCGVATNGLAYCWGLNASGELGTGSFHDSVDPVAVVRHLSFHQVSVGSSHTCGVTTASVAYCWGSNRDGRLGTNRPPESCAQPPCEDPTVNRTQPSLVFSDARVFGHELRFFQVSAGRSHTCGVVWGGAAFCWGFDAFGELGLGDESGLNHTFLRPNAVKTDRRFREVTVGGGPHTCGVTTNDEAFCWGSNEDGALGTDTEDVSFPTAVVGGLSFRHLSARGQRTCGVTTQALMFCWGDFTTKPREVPQPSP